MAHVCSCMSCPCKRYVCPQPCSTLSRIQQRVRMPMTLYTSRQSAFSISVKGPDLFATWEVMFGHTKNPSSGSRKWYKVKRNTSSFNASTAPFHHKGEHVSGLHFMVKVEYKKFTASNCFRFEA